MDNLMTISEAAKVACVAPSTLRRREREGKLKPARTRGGQRRYSRSHRNKKLIEGLKEAVDAAGPQD